MRPTNTLCRLALPVTALLCGLGVAAADDADVRQACAPDAMRLCSEFIPDVAKITACMTAKHGQLSQECRTAMVAGSATKRAPVQKVVRQASTNSAGYNGGYNNTYGATHSNTFNNYNAYNTTHQNTYNAYNAPHPNTYNSYNTTHTSTYNSYGANHTRTYSSGNTHNTWHPYKS